MGSMIQLAVGKLEIDWGKNSGFHDHSALFQLSDVKDVPYYYVQIDAEEYDSQSTDFKTVTEYKEGLSKPLNEVVDRIELLGHTLPNCEKEFLYLSRLNGFDPEHFQFQHLKEALRTIDVVSMSPDYGEVEGFGKFFRRQILPRLELPDITRDSGASIYDVSEAMENLSAYAILRLLSENPTARQLPVSWQYKDVEEGGWANKGEFVRSLDPVNRFLIVTEGSSDGRIIKHAFGLLRPHIADFFDFIDMEEGYPFTGTGNLFNFVKGLISISVQNKTVIIFDNDAEGVSGFRRCAGLNVLDNMRIIALPDLADFNSFDAIGPAGRHRANINGQAAAIECYLDVGAEACIRWSNYKPDIDAYQGALIGKEDFKREFVSQRFKDASYNYCKIESVLDLIVRTCVEMQETALGKQLD